MRGKGRIGYERDEVDGRVGERRRNIYIKKHQHGQAIQLLSVIMLHDLRVTMCVCSEGSALFPIIDGSSCQMPRQPFACFFKSYPCGGVKIGDASCAPCLAKKY